MQRTPTEAPERRGWTLTKYVVPNKAGRSTYRGPEANGQASLLSSSPTPSQLEFLLVP